MHKKIYNTILKSLKRDIKLPVCFNTIRSNQEIFEVLLQTSFMNQFIETTVKELSCFSEEICSADTVIKRIKTYGWKNILQDFKTINLQLFKKWIDMPKGKLYLAVDYYDIPRYIKTERDWEPRMKNCDDIDKIVNSRKQSGTHAYHGKILKECNTHLKWILNQCTHVHIRHCTNTQHYYKLMNKKGKNKATVAASRKLLICIWHMLIKGETFKYNN